MTTPFIPPHLEQFAARAYANHDRAHDYNHAIAVYENAIEIVARENIKMTELEAELFPYVMIGHDFLDHKLVAKGIGLPADEIADFYVSHVGQSSAMVIKHIHDNCSWSKRENSIPLEHGDWMRIVLQDADWIEGMVVERCIEFTKKFKPDKNLEQEVCNHIEEKLIHIPNHLNFASSRDLVKARGFTSILEKYLSENKK